MQGKRPSGAGELSKTTVFVSASVIVSLESNWLRDVTNELDT